MKKRKKPTKKNSNRELAEAHIFPHGLTRAKKKKEDDAFIAFRKKKLMDGNSIGKLSNSEISQALIKWRIEKRMPVGQLQDELKLKSEAYYRRINGKVGWKFAEINWMVEMGVFINWKPAKQK